MEVNTPASIRAFRAKSAADKVLSYMWYIHVLVSVNTETRLRANIAPLLEESVPPSSVLPASPDGTYVDRPGEHDRQDQEQQQQPQQPQQSRHCLTDHLVLWLFNHDTLPRLIDTAPVFAQANGYARILAAIPVSFHEEFCRRLYTLLFSKRIVEWPHDIDVPEPAIAAAEPAVVVVDEVPIGWEDTHHYDPKHEHQDVRGADLDGVMEDKDEEERALPATLLRPAASLWLQTPSLSSWDGNDIPPMERAAHFGTVSHPLPTDYFTDWAWSRNGSGPQVCVDEHESSGAQLKAPFSSPQTRGSALPGTLQVGRSRESHPFAKRVLSCSSTWLMGIAGFRTQNLCSGTRGAGAEAVCWYLADL